MQATNENSPVTAPKDTTPLDLLSDFETKVNKVAETARFPAEVEKQLPYFPGSAAVIYGQKNWREAIIDYEDTFGIYKLVQEHLTQLSAPLQFQELEYIVLKINRIGKKRNFYVLFAEPSRPTQTVEVKVEGQLVRTPNFLPAHAFAAYKDNTTSEKGMINGQQFEVATVPTSYRGFILVDKQLAKTESMNALVKILHEVGHIDELMSGKAIAAQVGDIVKPVKPLTEYCSTRLALKLAMDQFQRTQDKESIIAAAYQAAIYNRVVLGQV